MMALMGGIGLGKSALIDAPKERRQRLLAAQTAVYSPWTGMAPQPVQEADPFGSTLQGVTAGAMYGQMAKQNEMAQQELDLKKQEFNYKKNGNTPALGASETPVEELDPTKANKLRRPLEMQHPQMPMGYNSGYRFVNY